MRYQFQGHLFYNELINLGKILVLQQCNETASQITIHPLPVCVGFLFVGHIGDLGKQQFQ